MTRRRNFFNTGTQTNSFYPDNPVAVTETDLRIELDIVLFGNESHPIRHGHPCIIRRFRTDSDNKQIPCSCWEHQTGSHDPDCSYCFGEGFLSDEVWAMTYSHHSKSGNLFNKYKSVPPGEVRADQLIFYFRFDTEINHGDKIVEVKLDTEGAVVVPYIREAIYEIETLIKHRLDNGRIDYISCFVNENSALRPDVY